MQFHSQGLGVDPWDGFQTLPNGITRWDCFCRLILSIRYLPDELTIVEMLTTQPRAYNVIAWICIMFDRDEWRKFTLHYALWAKSSLATLRMRSWSMVLEKESYLTLHLNFIHKCVRCDIVSWNLMTMLLHIILISVHQDQQKMCMMCCKTLCKSSLGLKRHMKVHKDDVIQFDRINPTNVNFVCYTCFKLCKSIAGLKSRLRTHASFRNW